MPDGDSQILRLLVFGPAGFRTMAPLRYAAKFDPFLSLDCARVEGVGAQGSNFAIWQPWTQGERAQVFHLELGKEHTASALSGTAEMAFGGMLSGRVVPPGRPLKLCAVSRCFRAETSQKKEERPIFRVTQFTKAEMFAVCDPGESDEMLEHFLEVQMALFSELGLAYQVIEMPPEELGAPAYRKYDIEALFPGRMAAGGPPYGEISSSSNCTGIKLNALSYQTVFCDDEIIGHWNNGLFAIYDEVRRDDERKFCKGAETLFLLQTFSRGV